jgi:hypothetical protein
MRKLISISCVSLLLASAATGCFVSRKETVREVPKSSNTTVERRSTIETVPGDTEVRTKTTVEKY